MYFATARVQLIEADRRLSDHYYAFVTDFLEFENSVPFRDGDRYMESDLIKADGSTNKGAFGRAVRLILEDEYQLMLHLGFANPTPLPPDSADARVAEEPTAYKRPTVEQLVSRPFREVAFSRSVRAVYNFTCAMTGLKLVNGGGRPEVDAAHIRPVGNDHNGPDSVRNGIALSRSIHWMFNRGLLSLTDDYEILVVKKLVPDPIRRLLNRDSRILLPTDPRVYPPRDSCSTTGNASSKAEGTSANFSHHGLHENLEMGVRIHAAAVKRMVEFLQAMIEKREVAPIRWCPQ